VQIQIRRRRIVGRLRPPGRADGIPVPTHLLARRNNWRRASQGLRWALNFLEPSPGVAVLGNKGPGEG
jgi:hypothetical protein